MEWCSQAGHKSSFWGVGGYKSVRLALVAVTFETLFETLICPNTAQTLVWWLYLSEKNFRLPLFPDMMDCWGGWVGV